MFHEDDLPPNAILIEYISNMKPIGLSNFSRDYLVKFRQVLDDIHQAGIFHGDAKPRDPFHRDKKDGFRKRMSWWIISSRLW